MKEIFTMWKYTKMVVLTAITGAIYAAVLIPFKIFPIIPGFTEIRPGVVVPVVFGILFGPAAAWGSAIGNIIGDFMGGMFSLGTIFGAIGNFFFAFCAYKMWGQMNLLTNNTESEPPKGEQVAKFILVSILASSVCALIIAWGLEILKLLPFAAFASIVFVNNLICPVILGPFLLWLLYPRVQKLDLLWTEIMDPKDDAPHFAPTLGGALMWIGGLGGLVVGILVSMRLYQAVLFNFKLGGTGNIVVWSTTPFVIAFLLGCILI